jgi:hypothetical protein
MSLETKMCELGAADSIARSSRRLCKIEEEEGLLIDKLTGQFLVSI